MIITFEDLYREYYRIMEKESELSHLDGTPDPVEIYKLVFGSNITETIARAFFDTIEKSGCKNCSLLTAIIVMSTLLSKGCWYDWREEKYR